jgi:enoyl-CoA hydratase
MGLANRVVEPGTARAAAVELAREIAASPQVCMRHDRLSSYQQWALSIDDAIHNEYLHGIETVASGETRAGAERFRAGAGRHGAPASVPAE